MTLKFPFSVRVETPDRALGVAMNAIRTWLDGNQIQPTGFRSDPAASGAFEITFSQAYEARLFEEAFPRSPPNR
jgi:hypothetical protein